MFYLRLLGGASTEADGVAPGGTIAQRRRLALLERAEPLRWLAKAWAERASFLIHAAWDPRLDPLRGEPEFESILRTIGVRGDAS